MNEWKWKRIKIKINLMKDIRFNSTFQHFNFFSLWKKLRKHTVRREETSSSTSWMQQMEISMKSRTNREKNWFWNIRDDIAQCIEVVRYNISSPSQVILKLFFLKDKDSDNERRRIFILHSRYSMRWRDGGVAGRMNINNHVKEKFSMGEKITS